ncbi:hypothetical protein CTEN210_07756 [Chaetoceros tenuissimus]|uniref:Uncharacterized protein n=3 Tax=Chaetoceros tenuissimus TaxID=426638 RepID=A0AAD3CUH5_9STRA|nr:hypothetical protein CTEN210_07756 [Chaetoceros tenuissimus]
MVKDTICSSTETDEPSWMQIALSWVLNNNGLNNTELAILSNVSVEWRNVVLSEMKHTLQSLVYENHVSNLKNLLLPDMGFEIVKRRLAEKNITNQIVRNDSDSFCLAWFHPRGIKIKTLDVAEDFDESSSSDDDNGVVNFKSHLRNATSRLKNRKIKASSEFKTVADEWQGYRNAMDILIPFGYATAFVREYLVFAADFDLSSNCIQNTWNEHPLDLEEVSTQMNDKMFKAGTITKARKTTFAVRGATFARPHGFCLCWDDNTQQFESMNMNDDLPNFDHHNDNRRLETYKRRAKKKREKKCKIRMRDSLPRTCLSTLAKHPEYQGPLGNIEGRRQRCIQFLNAEKNRAVYMRTHPFDCGPCSGPITMFVVGIATEDGCFVSGLRRRFELGHLHGNNSEESLVEMSPICIATETSKTKSLLDIQRPSGSCSFQHSVDDSDDSSIFGRHILQEYGDANCSCKIQWKQQYDNGGSDEDDEDDDNSYHSEVDENRIARGELGPGRWHVYSAVFNGKNSIIRVDGVAEPLNQLNHAHNDPVLDGLTIGSDHVFDMSLCFGEGSDGEGVGSIAEIAVFKGAMDVGDMQVIEDYLMKKHGILHGCTGFENDIDSMDSSRHSTVLEINSQRKNPSDRWEEDRWNRDVHALMAHSPPFTAPSGKGIPLRIAARHRNVAWQKCCEVTGKPMRVSRIGSRLSNGSSDW